MPATLITGPAVEPLLLAEAKAFLKLDAAEDDALIASLIAAARIQVEVVTGRALIAQAWRITRDDWPANRRWRMPVAPVQAVTALRLRDAAGAAVPLSATALIIEASAGVVRLDALTPVAPLRPAGGVEIEITAGYGAAAADVPGPLVQAIRLLVAHWYERRGLIGPAAEAAFVPPGVKALLAPFRRIIP
jgi:uncharacterized phiE125 gp8 family phage protein